MTRSRLIGFVVAALLAAGCAAVPPEDRVAHDPWEGLNRKMYGFNDAVDRAVMKPIARGYKKVVPQPARTGVTNFSRNLMRPGSSLNNFLQGKPRRGLSELARFVINSTVGIAGLIDMATRAGIEEYDETFGQTAAVWGVPAGPYVVLPFLGPNTLRGSVTRPLDGLADPSYHYDDSSVRDKLYVLRLINLRANLLSYETLLEDSADPYVTMRETFLQNLRFRIHDGDPPVEEDDDEFYDEFLEDEEY
ncbi:MAG: VacJ family lipoprotein [Proteobacteria bacterium]|nr:VacJ family lipoprotein [Pseudomonadota bacterium]